MYKDYFLFFSLRERKGRLRRKMRRSNKISMTPLTQPVTSHSDDIELKNYNRSSSSPGYTRPTQKVYFQDVPSFSMMLSTLEKLTFTKM